MATAPMPTDTARLSFAKVAASAGKENVALTSFAKVTPLSAVRDPRHDEMSATSSNQDSIDMPSAPVVISSLEQTQNDNGIPGGISGAKGERPIRSQQEVKLIEAVKALKVAENRMEIRMPNLVVNGSGTKASNNRGDSEVVSEDVSVRTESGSDLGTKPPSLDGKSITSGTNFALDEKESLRPDDSASVKAAEDDESFSARGSIVAGSRIGSEAAARAYRAQFQGVADRHNVQPVQEHHDQGVFTPQSITSDQRAIVDAKDSGNASGPEAPDGFNLFYRQTPDEKLLEALDSPKDRIFLLRLEQEVIEFVKDSKEPFMDLPPCNSFCRMLTHKLADYYHMTHQVDGIAGAVRIFRTPFCRLPLSLTSMSNPPTSGNTPPPIVLPAMKIMRRGEDANTNPSPSKATSEAGSDAKERSMSAKEKMSREQREALYNKARERIFGKDDKSGEATPETEDSNDISRSSSVSTKDRAVQNRRGKTGKQRRDDAESFDVRSQYTPFFPQQQQTTWTHATQYGAMGVSQFNSPLPGNVQPPTAAQYGFSPQQYNQPMMSNNMPPYQMPQFPQSNAARFPPQPNPLLPYVPPTQAPSQMSQQWSPNMHHNQYQPQGQTQQFSQPIQPGQFGPPATAQQPSLIPYAFGQLPSTINPADPKSQHPIPGSFNRHAFNPKTQSFVPGNAPPMPQAVPHHSSPLCGASHHSSPHLSYNTYSPPQQQFINGMGYSMARQGSNQSVPSFHASPHVTNRPLIQSISLPQGLPQNMPLGVSTHNMHPGIPSIPHSGSHLPNFGNSSTLPPKPPTGM